MSSKNASQDEQALRPVIILDKKLPYCADDLGTTGQQELGQILSLHCQDERSHWRWYSCKGKKRESRGPQRPDRLGAGEIGKIGQDCKRTKYSQHIVSHLFLMWPKPAKSQLSWPWTLIRLELVAKDWGQVPLSSSFFKALNRNKDADTAHWLKSYLALPYTTSPKHLALQLCNLPGDGEEGFHVYYRAYKTTVKDKKAWLEDFLNLYPDCNWLITNTNYWIRSCHHLPFGVTISVEL